MVAYVVTLLISLRLLHSSLDRPFMRVNVALMPMLPSMRVIIAVVRHLSSIDELQQCIQRSKR